MPRTFPKRPQKTSILCHDNWSASKGIQTIWKNRRKAKRKFLTFWNATCSLVFHCLFPKQKSLQLLQKWETSHLTLKNFAFEFGGTPDHFFKSGHTFLWLYFIISFGHMPTEMCEVFFDAPTMRGFYAGYKRWWNWGTLPQMMVQSCHIEIALYFGWIHLNLKKLELWKVILKSLQTIQVWNSTKVFKMMLYMNPPFDSSICDAYLKSVTY